MSIERETRRTLRRVVFWHIVGDLLSLPRNLISSLAGFFGNLENAVYCLELDAARRYKLLTGADLGCGAGEDRRYAGMDPDYAESVKRRFLEDD